MKRLSILLIAILSLAIFTKSNVKAQQPIPDRQAIIDSLTTIDPDIKKYFPRWQICEPDLMIQIYRTFKYQYDDRMLDQQDIEVLAAPKEYPDEPYQILMLSCGKASMNSHEIDLYMSDMIVNYLSGAYVYSGMNRGYRSDIPKRDYCFSDIDVDVPLKTSQAETIINYLEPTNVSHAFTMSLFEQAVKLGESGFWLRHKLGNDISGYTFWTAGQASFELQRPLYINQDSKSRKGIPYLINAHLGGTYKINSGMDNDNSLFSWLQQRKLNGSPNGKLLGGIDFHMPFHPYFGVSLVAEVPFEDLSDMGIPENEYAMYDARPEVGFAPSSPVQQRVDQIAPVLRGTGKVAMFYHWWLDDLNPENYIRFDLGMHYSEVREMARYVDPGESELPGDDVTHLTIDNVDGLRTYKPNEFGDWIYAKVEYRNQAAFPFGISAQYSNQTFLSRLYIPLFSDWLYLEAKYSTPLRGVRPYEIENFFMISPVLRLTI